MGRGPARESSRKAGDLPDPGIRSVSPESPALQMDSSPAEPLGKPHKDTCNVQACIANDDYSALFKI
ncbi:hypothetical protein CapIbe_021117 [Capra ibex]